MKDLLIKILPVIIFTGQTALCFKEVRTAMGLDGRTEWMIAITGLWTLFLLNHWLTFLRPYSKFKRFEKTKDSIMQRLAGELSSGFKQKGIPLRINVMGLEKKLLSWVEPGKWFGRRPSVWKTHLKVVWVSPEMDHSPDRNLKISQNQGVAGMAYRSARPIWAVVHPEDSSLFALNSNQQAKIPELRIIYSFPIRAIDPKTLRVSSQIIGILNVDSESEESLKLETDEELFAQFARRVQQIAETYSTII